MVTNKELSNIFQHYTVINDPQVGHIAGNELIITKMLMCKN